MVCGNGEASEENAKTDSAPAAIAGIKQMV
jgi:hypothetical protein